MTHAAMERAACSSGILCLRWAQTERQGIRKVDWMSEQARL